MQFKGFAVQANIDAGFGQRSQQARAHVHSGENAFESRHARVGARSLHLSRREAALAAVLMGPAGQV